VAQVVQGLWIGPTLSCLERLSIHSFLAHGHEYHLYSYDRIGNVPDGVRLMHADSVLPRSMIFQYRSYPSYAGFANFFRYRLLMEKGGWWADTDVVCLRPLDFPDEFVFASERLPRGGETPTACLIRAPAGAEAMVYAWEQCQGKDPDRLEWGEVGARLLNETITRHGLTRFVRDWNTFAPFAFDEWECVLRPAGPDGIESLPPDAFTVHLWNEMWRRAGRDKDADYPSDCLYERLKNQYLSSVVEGDRPAERSPP
jgi:Glycosyltransferase sugar-binding region containing DXD motif